MPKDFPSDEWSAERIRAMLKEKASPTEGVAANIFFGASVPGDQLADAAQQAIEAAAKRVGSSAQVKVGKVHQLAKSVSVKGDPDVIAELQNVAGVKSVLPSEIDDIYPKPVRQKPVK
jgi:hypothetical protein